MAEQLGAPAPAKSQQPQSQINRPDQHQQEVHNDEANHILSRYSFVICWVKCVSRKGDADQFNFNFNLCMRSRIRQHPVSFDINSKTLHGLLQYVCNQQKYFATQRFPSSFVHLCVCIFMYIIHTTHTASTKREEQTQNDLDFMSNLMTISNLIEYTDDNNIRHICKGPRPKHWLSTTLIKSTKHDMKAMENTLNKILNSFKLIIDEHDLFTAFNFQTNGQDYNEFVAHFQSDMHAEANRVLTAFKTPTCKEWSFDLSSSINSDIAHGIVLDGPKEIEQKEFRWQVNEDAEFEEKEPSLIITLDSQSTQMTRFRVGGSMASFKIKGWKRRDQRWAGSEHRYHIKNGKKFIEVPWDVRTTKIKIVPYKRDEDDEITAELEIFGPLRNNHKLLLSERLRDIQFYQLYAVNYDGDFGDCNLQSHWALKFEGKTHLLTIEWLDGNRVKCTIEENTPIGQRRFWYCWYNDKKQLFTQRWGKLYMHPIVRSESEIAQYHLEAISAGCIGKLIDCWIKTCGNYEVVENSCQHFVRDMLSLFSMHGAEHLNMTLAKINRAIHPLMESCDVCFDNSRLKRLRRVLVDAFVEYQQGEVPDSQHGNHVIVEEDDAMRLWLRNECELEEHYDLFRRKGLKSLGFIKDCLNEETFDKIFGKKFNFVHKTRILKRVKDIR